MPCPCDVIPVSLPISNPPGRSTIVYRAGDYVTFRYALLQPVPGEVELLAWRPTAEGDLALQMMEWWAYVADILTFYNERIANQGYLRTADLPESVQRLIRVLGYRPRPGIGPQGTLAALLSGPKPITLPPGFQVQSKPGPGKQPQVFETSAPILLQQPDALAAVPVPDPSLLAADGSVLLGGTVSIKPGDQLLLLRKDWDGSDDGYAIIDVQDSKLQKDPSGNAATRVWFTGISLLPPGAAAEDYRILRSTQSAHPWTFSGSVGAIGNYEVAFDSITRGIRLGDPALLVINGPPPGSPPLTLVKVITYREGVSDANSPNQPPVPIPHSIIGFGPTWTTNNSLLAQLSMRYAWQDVGTLIPSPAKTLSPDAALSAIPPAVFPPVSGSLLLVEDSNGSGESASGVAGPDQTTLQLSGLPDSPLTLASPLNVLFNLLPVTRGKTVANEALGGGDATVAGQEFVLKNSPLTYLLSVDSTSGDDYSSTLRVWVNGVQWKEVPSFFGQGPTAHVFVTREDEQNKTHVQFGDGVYGSRLPSGVNNIVATYRYGSGADSPDAGSLTVILKPQPGLKAIRNPVPMAGGADPDPPAKIKKYAPQSVLTFGRAVSADDYETIAAQAPGVARAKSYWTWDSIQQRALVKVYVGDDENAVVSARAALSRADDPNRPVQVVLARRIGAGLSLSLLVDPDYASANIVSAATQALIDPDTGLFGSNAIGIGQRVYESQIFEACLGVPGALAVHDLQFSMFSAGPFGVPFRFDPGEGGFFDLTADGLTISPEVATNAG